MQAGTIWFTLAAIDNVSPTLSMVSNSLNHLGRVQRQWSMNLGLLGAAMTTAITLPMKELVKTAGDFEQQFANVVKTVEDLNVDQFGKLNDKAAELREEIRGLARELPFTHKQLAEIAAFGGQFGVPTEALGKFTEVVAKLGTAIDGIETETAAKSLAQIITITSGDIARDIERLASELVHLGNIGISTEGTILEITRRMSGAGATAGMSAKFMMSLSAAVANLGHRSELGGTALSNTVLKISRAVSKGGEDLAKFARIARVSADEFKKAWDTNSEKALMDLFKGLASVPRNQLASEVAKLFGTAARHNQVILSLVNSYGALTEQIRQGDRAYKEQFALQEEFRKKAVVLWNQLTVLGNKFRDIAITIGGPFIDAIRDNLHLLDPFIEKLQNLAKAFENANPATQRFIVIVTLLVASLPLIAVAISAVTYTFGQLWSVIAGGISSLVFLNETLQGLQILPLILSGFDGIVALMIRFGLAIDTAVGKVGGFVRAIFSFWGVFDKVNLSVWKFVDSVARLTILDGLSFLVETLTRTFYGLMTVLAGSVVLAGFVAILVDFRDALASLGLITATYESKHTTTLESLSNVLKDLKKGFSELLGPLGQFISGLSTLEKLSLPFPFAGQLIFFNRVRKVFSTPELPTPEPYKAFTKKEIDSQYILGKAPIKDPKNISFRSLYGKDKDIGFFNVGEHPDPWNMDNLNRYKTAFDFISSIDKKEEESLMKHWRDTQRYMEEAEISAKKLREIQKAINEEYERRVEFESYLGFKDFEEFTKLNEAFKKMQDIGIKPPAEFLEKFGEAAKGAIEYLKANGWVVPEYFENIANSFGKAKYQNLADETSNLSGSVKELFEILDNRDKVKIDLRNTEMDLFVNRGSEAIGKIYGLIKAWVIAKDEFKVVPKGVDPKEWEKLSKAVDQLNIEKIARAFRETKAFDNILKLITVTSPLAARAIKQWFDSLGGKETKDPVEKLQSFAKEYKKTINNLSTAFSKLSQIMGDSFNGPIKRLGELVGLMNVGVEVGESMKTSWDQLEKANFKTAEGMGNLVQGAIGLVITLAQAVALMNKATDVAGKFNRILNGAATGASIGAAFGGYGALVGLIVGAIWGAAKKVPWEEIGKRISSRLGLTISEGLSRQIQATANEKFGGDWLTAEVYSLKDIITEVGGVSRANYDVLLRTMRDSFSLYEQHKLSAIDVAHVLESFSDFLEVATDNMGFIRKDLREIITLSYQFGIQSKQINEYVTGVGDSLLEQVSALAKMSGQYDTWIKIGERVEEARKALAEAGNDTEKIAKANQELSDALRDQAAAAEMAEEELRDLGIVIAGNVFAAVINGRSLSSAILAAKDGLKDFFDAYKALGLVPDDPLVNLLKIQSDIVQAIPNVINGVDALGNSIVGLTNLNLLDPEVFASIQRAGYNAYLAIQKEVDKVGGSARDALLPMQDYLHRAVKAAEELGIPLDENTQAMIDQSKALGIWKDIGPSAMELLTSAVGRLVDKIQLLLEKMFGLPSELPNPFKNWEIPDLGLPTLPPGSHPKDPPPDDFTDPEDGRAVGSKAATGNWFEQWDPRKPVSLHGIEAVIRPDQTPAFVADYLATQSSPRPSVGLGDQPILLVLPDRKVLARVVVEDMPSELERMGISAMGRRR